MQVVALVPGGIGEQILFFPTLDHLKQRYPNSEIDVVVEPRAKAAYRVSKSVNDVLLFDFQDRNSPADWANLLGVLRDRDYEAVLSADRSSGTNLLLWLTGIPTRVGYASGTSKLFLTNAVPFKADQYLPYVYHDLLQGLAITGPCPELSLRIPKADQDWAEAERKRLGINGYVLICPDSPTGYSLENWRQIIQDFQQKQPDLPVVVVQTEENQDVVIGLSQTCPGLKVTKPGDLGKLAAMIAGANLMLCTEGVPMHLAVALQVYTLVLFGSTDPAKALPKADKFLGLQSATGKLADISPEQVLQKVWGG
ncbi:MAG: glycosyltransferase family 9 protein [Leptolyngbya sp. IPPAS B-1204]|nr:glycosyltransferase family 9 protein [Elainella sp. C42_A2020_010]RNJ69327.1 MAG: lipopolysaccharide heptosyltransferase family protein [Leptolyngbya sp. IPPAS B-1204]